MAARPAGAGHAHGTSERFKATSHRSFDDVDHWRKVFDDPERDAWQKPAQVMELLELREGMVVADIGAGTGYFSAGLSRAVGDSGTAFAVETEPNLVAYLRERAEVENTANLVPVLASIDNPRLPAGSLDLALLVDTFHHIDDRLTYFGDFHSLLKVSGRIAVIDWKPGKLPVGPAADHKIDPQEVVTEMEAAGYELSARHETLDYQYFLVFRSRR